MAETHEYKDLLVPVRHPDDVNRVTELASTIVDFGKITFLTVIEEGSFFSAQKDWRVSERAIEQHRKKITKRGIRVNPTIRYSENVWEGVLNQADEEDSDLILIGWGEKIKFRSLSQTPLERIFANSNRDVLAFKNRTGDIQNIQKILFPVGNKDYDYSKRLEITSKLIKNTGADCVFVHVLQEDEDQEEAKEILQGPKEFMNERGIDCETKKIKHHDVSEALIEESKGYDLIFLGPTRDYVFSRYLFGWMTDKIVNNADCSALVFKEGEYKWTAWLKGVFSGFIKKLKSPFS